MAQISHHQIVSSLYHAEKEHGEHPSAKALAAKLLEEIAGQELAYSRASERKATEAEQDLGKIVELIPHGEDEPPEDAA